MRIGNLEFRNKEIVVWFPNYFYGRESEYIMDGQWYISKEHNGSKIHEDCFKNPESCMTIAYFVKDDEGYDLKFVGKRPIDKSINWDDFRILIKEGYKVLNHEEV